MSSGLRARAAWISASSPCAAPPPLIGMSPVTEPPAPRGCAAWYTRMPSSATPVALPTPQRNPRRLARPSEVAGAVVGFLGAPVLVGCTGGPLCSSASRARAASNSSAYRSRASWSGLRLLAVSSSSRSWRRSASLLPARSRRSTAGRTAACTERREAPSRRQTRIAPKTRPPARMARAGTQSTDVPGFMRPPWAERLAASRKPTSGPGGPQPPVEGRPVPCHARAGLNPPEQQWRPRAVPWRLPGVATASSPRRSPLLPPAERRGARTRPASSRHASVDRGARTRRTSARSRRGSVPGRSPWRASREPRPSCCAPWWRASRPPRGPGRPGSAAARRCLRCACRARGRKAAPPWEPRSRYPQRAAKRPARPMRSRGCPPGRRRQASPGTLLRLGCERRDGAAGHRSHVLVHDPSIAVDEEGLRHAEDPVGDGRLSFRIDQRGIRAGALLQEILRPGLLVLVHDPEELDVGQATRRGGQGRVLLEARDAPGRPEVDDHRLAAKVLERKRGPAPDRDQGEGGRGPADER